jgi:hypothetical protein
LLLFHPTFVSIVNQSQIMFSSSTTTIQSLCVKFLFDLEQIDKRFSLQEIDQETNDSFVDLFIGQFLAGIGSLPNGHVGLGIEILNHRATLSRYLSDEKFNELIRSVNLLQFPPAGLVNRVPLAFQHGLFPQNTPAAFATNPPSFGLVTFPPARMFSYPQGGGGSHFGVSCNHSHPCNANYMGGASLNHPNSACIGGIMPGTPLVIGGNNPSVLSEITTTVTVHHPQTVRPPTFLATTPPPATGLKCNLYISPDPVVIPASDLTQHTFKCNKCKQKKEWHKQCNFASCDENCQNKYMCITCAVNCHHDYDRLALNRRPASSTDGHYKIYCRKCKTRSTIYRADSMRLKDTTGFAYEHYQEEKAIYEACRGLYDSDDSGIDDVSDRVE